MSQEKGRFPKQKAKIVKLAQDMVSGFSKNAAIYPDPPVSAKDLKKYLDESLKTGDEAEQIHAEALKKTAAEDKALDKLEGAMKKDLRYAENKVDFDNADLKKIGWHGRHPKESLEPPGGCFELEAAVDSDKKTVTMTWKNSKEGGRPSVYKIMRFTEADSGWHLIDISHYRKVVLTGQPEKTKLRFRIVASNRAGDGKPSNTVSVMV